MNNYYRIGAEQEGQSNLPGIASIIAVVAGFIFLPKALKWIIG